MSQLLFLQTTAPRASMADLPRFVREFWPILAFTALGLAAVYLLLPRARRYPPLWGGALAGLALLAGGWWLLRSGSVWPENLLFYSFALIAVLFGGLMITQSNPVHAALSFAMVVLSSCGLFLLQAAPFLMAATIIIYAGAIVVTFLFVIMLAQQEGYSNADHRSREPFLATVAGFVLLGAVLCVLERTYDTSSYADTLQKLDALLIQTDRARRATELDEIRAALGDVSAFLNKFREEAQAKTGPAERTKASRQQLDSALDGAEEAWNVPNKNVTVLTEQLDKVYAAGLHVKLNLEGGLQPDSELPLSRFSGTPANLPAPRDAHGRVWMPADNVASLGRSLFTDYLLAVELAGTLLLVATIGAIVIAGRRTEGLR